MFQNWVRGAEANDEPLPCLDFGATAKIAAAMSLDSDTLYPVCGYGLRFASWVGSSASDEICPSCGNQFSYDDCAGGDRDQQSILHDRCREQRVAEGMPWSSYERELTHENGE